MDVPVPEEAVHVAGVVAPGEHVNGVPLVDLLAPHELEVVLGGAGVGVVAEVGHHAAAFGTRSDLALQLDDARARDELVVQ